jgi:hypothetical protein
MVAVVVVLIVLLALLVSWMVMRSKERLERGWIQVCVVMMAKQLRITVFVREDDLLLCCVLAQSNLAERANQRRINTR